MQDKTWYSILGLDAEPLFLQDHMLNFFLHYSALSDDGGPSRVDQKYCILFQNIFWNGIIFSDYEKL